MAKRFVPLKVCANGDGNPVCPPSKVICRACMDKITATLRQLAGLTTEPPREQA